MSACNDHCQDCPFACHTEVEDGHTPEWLIRMHESVNALHDRLAMPGYSIPRTYIAGVDQ